MGEHGTKDGLSRRDLIKRSAAAGAIVWTTPVLQSSAAWGEVAGCNECDGLTLYSKYAPGNAHVTGNQCLAPCPPVTVISNGSDVGCGLFSVVDDVESDANFAAVTFSDKVRLIRTAIKASGGPDTGASACYVTSCTDGWCEVRTYGQGVNPVCDQEMSTGVPLAGPYDPPLFTFYSPGAGDECGTAPAGACTCTQEIRKVVYDTNGTDTTLNFIEIIMCLKGTSVLPPGCTVQQPPGN